MERFLNENKRVGAERVSDIFNTVVQNLRNQNILSDCFTFIDASAVVSKANLWEARDKALSDKEKTLNNDNVHKYAADLDARFGAKSKSKYWFGYKRTQAVDMGTGLITKLDTLQLIKLMLKEGSLFYLKKVW